MSRRGWTDADMRAVEGVSDHRIAARIEQLSRIGRTRTGGVSRLALSPEENEARHLVASWLEPLGYECGVDDACNLIALGSQGSDVVIGSHLDTVPNGGAYDGALGVVAAVEAAEALRAAGREIAPVVAAWMGEEGHLFGRTLLGSAAALGLLAPDDWIRTDQRGDSLAGLAEKGKESWAGRTHMSIENDVRCYLELHIEQGPRLKTWGLPVGVVSGIVGITHALVAVRGRADHAGTTPMEMRHDALAAASEMVLAAERLAVETQGAVVATVGELKVEPAAHNVIPDKVVFSVDVRSMSDSKRQQFVERLSDEFEQISELRDVSHHLRVHYEMRSVELDTTIRSLLRSCIEEVGVEASELASGAVHDAQNWAVAGVPTGMVFVRSEGGSHNPKEHASEFDAASATRALVLAICSLSSGAT